MKKLSVLILLLSTLSFTKIYAQDAAQKGLEIAQLADVADAGFESSTVELKMILRNKNGQVSERLLSNRTLELTEDGDKSLILVDFPRFFLYRFPSRNGNNTQRDRFYLWVIRLQRQQLS